MAEPKQHTVDSRGVEREQSQLTLDDWAGRLRAIPESAATRPRGPQRGEEITPASAQSDDRPSSRAEASGSTSQRPSAAELLETPGALLTRSHLRELGLERRAVDAVFRTLAVVFLPGYSRPMIRVEEFLELVEQCTYRDDRVRPCHA
jgi:hypothetical protein